MAPSVLATNVPSAREHVWNPLSLLATKGRISMPKDASQSSGFGTYLQFDFHSFAHFDVGIFKESECCLKFSPIPIIKIL